MVSQIDSVIDQLRHRRLGHGPKTLGILSNAVMAQTSGAKFTACFDPHGVPNLDHFKMYLQNITPPARIQVPLGLMQNHISGMVIDIDANGKSDVLFMNPLGNSDKGGYAREAQLFMDALREKFPKKNDYYVTKPFQDLRTGDNFCGDWTLWFLRNAAATPTQPLGEIAERFNNLPSVALPKPQNLREEHIVLLQQHRTQMARAGAQVAPPDAVVEPPKIHITNT